MVPAIPIGFYRGVHDYKWKNKNGEYLYSSAFGYGLVGSVVYICPLLFANNLSKELYRAEVDIRGLTEHKKTDYYNSLI